MSYPIMPALPMSMTRGVSKTPVFNTAVQKTAAARSNAGISFTPFPTWDFEFDMDRIVGNEALSSSILAQFLGVYLAVNGPAGLFLFTDPQDHAVVYAGSGLMNLDNPAAGNRYAGDGASTHFQLMRKVGSVGWDVVQNVNGAPTLQINGVTTSAYSISAAGLVTFNTAPANNATLTWQGSFYFLCRFEDPKLDTTRVFTLNDGVSDQWNAHGVKFSSEFV